MVGLWSRTHRRAFADVKQKHVVLSIFEYFSIFLRIKIGCFEDALHPHLRKILQGAISAARMAGTIDDVVVGPLAAARVGTAPSVAAETIMDDELCASCDEAIASSDDGTRNIACGALHAVDEFQRFACRQTCAVGG